MTENGNQWDLKAISLHNTVHYHQEDRGKDYGLVKRTAKCEWTSDHPKFSSVSTCKKWQPRET